jgi:hypothetical protein
MDDAHEQSPVRIAEAQPTPPTKGSRKPAARKSKAATGKSPAKSTMPPAPRTRAPKKERASKKPVAETLPQMTLRQYAEAAVKAVRELADDAGSFRLLAVSLREVCEMHLQGRHQASARHRNIADAESCDKIAAELESGAFEIELDSILRKFQDYANGMRDNYGIRTSLSCFVDGVDTSRQEPFTPVEQRLEEQLLQEFRCVWENLPPPIKCQVQDRCGGCGVVMNVRQNEGVLVCPFCGAEAPNLDATSTMTAYGEEVEMPQVNNKRKGHFSDKLLFFRAQQPVVVPMSVLREVMSRLHNMGCRDTSEITYQKVGQALKALRLKDWYDHKMKIACLVTGLRAPFLDAADEERCKKFFDAIMEPYERHKPTGRTNFICYNYCIFQFFRMLGLNHLLPYFCLLKDTDKLDVTEDVYKRICADLRWEYSSTKELMDRGGYEDGKEYVVPEGVLPPGERPVPLVSSSSSSST